MFILEGEVILETSNETIFLKTGDILFIPKNSMYVAQWKANPIVHGRKEQMRI